jgi:REP element-mobilizing transposase RayT
VVSWTTRGRKPVLRDQHVLKLRELIPALCDERGIDLFEVAVGNDHVQVLFGLRPTHSVATAVREIKSRAGLEMLSLYPELRVRLGGNLVWDDRYTVETVSTARVEEARDRVRNDRGPNEPFARAS